VRFFQVVKQSLAFRVIDEQQIERHFTSEDISELYTFKPDRLQPNSREALRKLAPPKDKILAELVSVCWIFSSDFCSANSFN